MKIPRANLIIGSLNILIGLLFLYLFVADLPTVVSNINKKYADYEDIRRSHSWFQYILSGIFSVPALINLFFGVATMVKNKSWLFIGAAVSLSISFILFILFIIVMAIAYLLPAYIFSKIN